MDGLRIGLLVVGAFVGVAGFWLLVMWVLAQVGGWPRLAEKYPRRQGWGERCWSLQSVMMQGWLSYNGVVRVCADAEGVHFAVMFPFSIAHAPLSVPWHELSGKTKPRWFYTGVVLHFQQVPGVVMEIRQGLADRLVAEAAGKWGYGGN